MTHRRHPPLLVFALAAALLELIEDDSLRRRMGQAAVRHARRFSPALVVRQAEQLFDALLEPVTGEGPGALSGPGLRRTLTSRSHALKDGAHVAAGNVLRRARGSHR